MFEFMVEFKPLALRWSSSNPPTIGFLCQIRLLERLVLVLLDYDSLFHFGF